MYNSAWILWLEGYLGRRPAQVKGAYRVSDWYGRCDGCKELRYPHCWVKLEQNGRECCSPFNNKLSFSNQGETSGGKTVHPTQIVQEMNFNKTADHRIFPIGPTATLWNRHFYLWSSCYPCIFLSMLLITITLRNQWITLCSQWQHIINPHHHSFIHSSRYFYSASSSPPLLRGALDYSIDTVSELTHQSAKGNCEWRSSTRSLRGG